MCRPTKLVVGLLMYNPLPLTHFERNKQKNKVAYWSNIEFLISICKVLKQSNVFFLDHHERGTGGQNQVLISTEDLRSISLWHPHQVCFFCSHINMYLSCNASTVSSEIQNPNYVPSDRGSTGQDISGIKAAPTPKAEEICNKATNTWWMIVFLIWLLKASINRSITLEQKTKKINWHKKNINNS